MDPRFLEYYNLELRHLAESCGEFAADFPKIAGRLGLEGFIKEFQCPDPYVERLLEGFAYMAARVQLKVDAEYPQFTQHLLEMVYPDYLAPTPSLGIVRLWPDTRQGSLVDGLVVPRGTRLKSGLGHDVHTSCQYQTAHALKLWPIEVAEARYISSLGEVGQLGVPQPSRARSALRLRLRLTAGERFAKLPLESLTFYLRGGDEVAMRLYEADDERRQPAYYALRREPRVLSTKQRARGARSSYVGSEVFISLVDAGCGPFRSSLRQLGVTALCTNRDLPLLMPVGSGETDLSLASGAPVSHIRFVAGPSEPRASTAHREVAWRLISHLSLNYLSLSDDQRRRGAAALRELLDLYGALGDPLVRRHIEGVIGIGSKPIHRRLPVAGPVSIARGLEVALSLDETPFAGSGPFLLAAVLEQFFARYVSINSFCEAVMTTTDRGEVKRWPARPGQRHLV